MTDWLDLPFDEPARPPVHSVSEVTAAIKDLLESSFGLLAVDGELSNCRTWSSGHVYCTLKDDRAQLRAVMFRTAARTLKFRPEDGMRVVARGQLGVYDAKGEYQLIIETLEPHGLGALQAAFEQRKRALQAEGLFDTARKRPLPVLPRRIGLVTSTDGAAVRDVLRILLSRHPMARVVVRAARVQGDGAADDLVRALRAIVRVPEIDVVIIGRGGGSAEDLWAFNDEGLARAIAACPVPVIAAVGHETDFTIADFVADVRAATPSNAAEIVVDRADHFFARIDRARRQLGTAFQLGQGRRHQRTDRLHHRVIQWSRTIMLRGRDRDELGQRLDRALAGRLGESRQRFEHLRRRLERHDAPRVIAALRTRLVTADGRLHAVLTRTRLEAAGRAAALGAQLDALSPLSVLGRGYAVCWNGSRTGIIRSAAAVSRGDRVRVTLADGEIGCVVDTPHA